MTASTRPGWTRPAAETFGLQLLDSRPVDCQEFSGGFPYDQLYGVDLEGQETDSHGLPLVPTTLCGRTSTAGALALKDLRGSGGEATVAPGATAKVPFTLRYVGDAGPSFALSASTALPGAAVSPSPAVLTPAAPGFQDATVTVAVPAGTAPGAYAVTLTATVGGQVRTAQGTVHVIAPASTTATSGSSQEADDDAERRGRQRCRPPRRASGCWSSAASIAAASGPTASPSTWATSSATRPRAPAAGPPSS